MPLRALQDRHNRRTHTPLHLHRKETDIKVLEKWARDLFYYNGDDLILDIWARAGELKKCTKTTAFAKQIKSEFTDQIVDFNEVRHSPPPPPHTRPQTNHFCRNRRSVSSSSCSRR